MRRIILISAIVYLILVSAYFILPRNGSGTPLINLEVWLELTREEMSDVLSDIEEYRRIRPHIAVRVKNYTFASLKPQYESHAKRGSAPDILLGVNDWMGELSEEGHILAVDNWIDYKNLPDYGERVMKAMKWNGKIYGLPQRFECLALLVNRKLVPEAPVNTDELMKVSERLLNEDIFPLMVDYSNFYFHAPWTAAWSTDALQKDGNIIFDSDGMRGSLKLIKKFLDNEVISKNSTSESALHFFTKGKCAMMIDGPWVVSNLGSMEVTVEPIPQVSGEGWPEPYLAYKAFMISANSSSPSEAVKLAEYLSKRFWKRQEKDNRFQGFRRAAEHTRPMPNHPNMKTVWALGNVLLDRVLRRGENLEETLKQIQTAADAGSIEAVQNGISHLNSSDEIKIDENTEKTP